MNDAQFDYIIVGGGTAGCVLANRLSANPDIRVLMVEAGGSSRHPYVEIPLMLPKLLGNPRFDWLYKTAPEPHLGGRTRRLCRGDRRGGQRGRPWREGL